MKANKIPSCHTTAMSSWTGCLTVAQGALSPGSFQTIPCSHDTHQDNIMHPPSHGSSKSFTELVCVLQGPVQRPLQRTTGILPAHATQQLASASQAMLHTPAHRQTSHHKPIHHSPPPPMSTSFPAMTAQYSSGRGANVPHKPTSTAERQWLEYLEASEGLTGHNLKPSNLTAPEPSWLDYTMLSRSMSQPPTSSGFAQHFVPAPQACVSW